jgi:hypothetical protein
MKTIELKKTPTLDYKQTLCDILSNAPVSGYSVEEVRLAVKALDALDKATTEVSFEDEVYEFVKNTVNQAKYRIASKELVEFLSQFV